MKKKEESFFKLITQKPWEASQSVLDNEHDGKTLAMSKAKLGVRTVMVVSTVLFSLLDSSTGLFFKEFSICSINSNFQFNL